MSTAAILLTKTKSGFQYSFVLQNGWITGLGVTLLELADKNKVPVDIQIKNLINMGGTFPHISLESLEFTRPIFEYQGKSTRDQIQSLMEPEGYNAQYAYLASIKGVEVYSLQGKMYSNTKTLQFECVLDKGTVASILEQEGEMYPTSKEVRDMARIAANYVRGLNIPE